MRRSLIVVAALFASLAVTSCAGGGGTTIAPTSTLAPAAAERASSDAAAATPAVTARLGPTATTAALPLPAGFSGAITWHATTPNASVGIAVPQRSSAARVTLGKAQCPTSIPPILLINPFWFPITLGLESFTLGLPCSVNGDLFGLSFYQSYPLPATIVPTKLGNAIGVRNRLTFTPAIAQLTLPAKSELTLTVLPETSTADSQLPAIPNVATALTANAPAVPNTLAVSAPDISGGTTFESACYLPNDPTGPGLGGVHVLGTPSFYCVLLPGLSGVTTAFGGAHAGDVVKLLLGPNAKPDRSLVQLDGPSIYAGCAPVAGGQECDAPPFSIPVYSRAIVSNDAEIEACVPAVPNTDCNGVVGTPPAASTPSVPADAQFQLLFADDATYNAANGFGGVSVRTAPPCAISTTYDVPNGDGPPGYSDPTAPAGATATVADFVGVGPNVEFDINTLGAGPCTITFTEDTGLKRSYALQLTVSGGEAPSLERGR